MMHDSTALPSEIADRLRREIVAGRLAPGTQLPTWSVLQQRFGIARPTLMKAMAELKRDGLIVADSTRGSFVAGRPPHLVRTVLVLPLPNLTPVRLRVQDALSTAAKRLHGKNGRQLEVVEGVASGSPAMLQLADEARRGCIAGLINPGGGDLHMLKRYFPVPVPMVRLIVRERGMPSIPFDVLGFAEHAMTWLKSRGRQRIAVITTMSGHGVPWSEVISHHGFESRRGWLLHLPLGHSATVQAVAALLTDPDIHPRPDAVIVEDDNLVGDVLAGFAAVGARIGTDLDIVTHTNWPLPVPAPRGVRRLGFDLVEALRQSVALIDDLRAGLNPQPPPALPARFENRLDSEPQGIMP